MALLRRAALLAALLPCVGCERTPTMVEIDTSRIAVHGVLIADADSATVLLTRPHASFAGWEFSTAEPVSNAEVRLVHAADTITLTAGRACRRVFTGNADDAASDGCYTAAVPGGVRAGGNYALLVDVPGGPPIRGETRVPLPPQILEPAVAADPIVLRMHYPSSTPDLVTVRWAGAGPDSRTELRFVPERPDCMAAIAEGTVAAYAGLDVIGVLGADSAIIAARSVHCGQATAERYDARLVVTVYDPSYTRYSSEMFRGESARLPNASAGVTGALGVFGSAASSAVPVVLSER